MLDGRLDDGVERGVDLDVGVDVEHALEVGQEVPQREWLDGGGELGDVVRDRHVLEALGAEVDVDDGHQFGFGLLSQAHLQRVVDDHDEEGRIGMHMKLGR